MENLYTPFLLIIFMSVKMSSEGGINKLDEKKVLRRISNLLAVAYLYDNSITLLDRIANSLSKESALRSIYDAFRVIDVATKNKEIIFSSSGDSKQKKFIIIKKKDEKTYFIPGTLPSEKDLEIFYDMLDRSTLYARKAGTLALALVKRLEQKREREKEGGENQ